MKFPAENMIWKYLSQMLITMDPVADNLETLALEKG